MQNELDWDMLEKTAQAQNCLPFEQVKHQFRKVAWDVYKPLHDSEKLWELREVDGQKFLFALYEADDAELKVESQEAPSDWTATASLAGDNITLSWKGIPFYLFSSSEYKFKTSEANEFAKFIQKKAAFDDSFVDSIKAMMPEIKRTALNKLMNQREA